VLVFGARLCSSRLLLWTHWIRNVAFSNSISPLSLNSSQKKNRPLHSFTPALYYNLLYADFLPSSHNTAKKVNTTTRAALISTTLPTAPFVATPEGLDPALVVVTLGNTRLQVTLGGHTLGPSFDVHCVV